MSKKKQKWMRLDNAAKIFSAAKRKYWSNIFRISATLKDEIDREVLQLALNNTISRFPSIAVRVKGGMFWYYLEQIEKPPRVIEDVGCPLMHLNFESIKKCGFCVLYYNNRVSVEIFHSLTDANGGMIFMKTILSEYLRLRYKIDIPPENGVVSLNEMPSESELEDSFLKYAGDFSYRKKERSTFRIKGTPEKDRFKHVIFGTLSSTEIKRIASEYNCSVTVFLTAVLIQSIVEIQNAEVIRKRQKPVKVTIPINLRKFFKSDSLRNFALCVNVGIDPKFGEYSFEEIIEIIKHQIALEVTPKKLAGQIAANVNTEKSYFLRLTPLFIKNFVMKQAYLLIGESKGCITISNLGLIELPEIMKQYIKYMDFTISPQITYPNNCSVVTVGDILRISMIRSNVEPTLERLFFTNLVKRGLNVTIESNER